MRRCGKSVLLGLIQGELRQQGLLEAQLLSLNFESVADVRVRSREAVLAAVDKQKAESRSNAHLLSWELATYLAGRYVEITLLGKGRVSVHLQLPFF